mmetsp:Transcript_28108/g.37379  ORF Transcript_28108/g.37379 Transcript_28108/m.37379 type:complete len:87 (+) Transcript_28108:634-894(+)
MSGLSLRHGALVVLQNQCLGGTELNAGMCSQFEKIGWDRLHLTTSYAVSLDKNRNAGDPYYGKIKALEIARYDFEPRDLLHVVKAV